MPKHVFDQDNKLLKKTKTILYADWLDFIIEGNIPIFCPGYSGVLSYKRTQRLTSSKITSASAIEGLALVKTSPYS